MFDLLFWFLPRIIFLDGFYFWNAYAVEPVAVQWEKLYFNACASPIRIPTGLTLCKLPFALFTAYSRCFPPRRAGSIINPKYFGGSTPPVPHRFFGWNSFPAVRSVAPSTTVMFV